jgi:hypothetical protein
VDGRHWRCIASGAVALATHTQQLTHLIGSSGSGPPSSRGSVVLPFAMWADQRTARCYIVCLQVLLRPVSRQTPIDLS